jgi:ferrous iron transport protein B
MIIKIKNTRFAAIGAIRREMNNAKWTWFAVGGNKRFGAIVILGTCFNRPGVFSFA